MKTLDIVHPAAKALVDVSLSQDSEVGDGTTTVVLLAAEFLREARPFVEEGVHPRALIRAYRKACALARARVEAMATSIAGPDGEARREELVACARTSLESKLVRGERDFFASMVVDALEASGGPDARPDALGVRKAQGGGLRDSFLVRGVAFPKTFSYAGFEMQPKREENPKILLLNLELELKAERDNAEVRLTDPADYQALVDAEWNVILAKVDAIVDSGATVVLSRLAIGDLATQRFADRGVFSAGRVPEADLRRVAAAAGGSVLSTVAAIDPSRDLGTCALFEETQVGAERYEIFRDCPVAAAATLVLRGGSPAFLDEAERSIVDALCAVRRARATPRVVPGGGAVDMEASRAAREAARAMPGRDQLFVNAYARALEVVPRSLAANAGLDAIGVLNALRQRHAEGSDAGSRAGVDVSGAGAGVADALAAHVWEPVDVKRNAIAAATEAACLVLSVDETVRNPRSQAPDAAASMATGRR